MPDAKKLKEDFPRLVRYAGVLDIGRQLGLTEWQTRQLVEGEEAPIFKVYPPGAKRAYYQRDRAIEVMTQ